MIYIIQTLLSDKLVEREEEEHVDMDAYSDQQPNYDFRKNTSDFV